MSDTKKTTLQLAQNQAQAAINETNKQIEELGENTQAIYNALNEIQAQFDRIRNIPSDDKLQYVELKKVRLKWKQLVEKIEKDCNDVGLRIAVTALSTTVAMGLATTFGVASTGTVISSLSGTAAANAALAWLGLGGGIAAGNILLGLAGPIGWTTAGAAAVLSGLVLWKQNSDTQHLEDIFISISNRYTKSYQLAIVELKERITRIKDETIKIREAIDLIKTFGLDYNTMTEQQQYILGSYVNLMNSSTQLLTNPILGLLPKYSKEDYNQFKTLVSAWPSVLKTLNDYEEPIMYLADLLYKIKLDDHGKNLLWKSLKDNPEFLTSMNMTKTEFTSDILDLTLQALTFKEEKCELA